MRNLLTTSVAFAALAASALAIEEKLPVELEGVGVSERLGSKVDLDLEFTAENGRQVPLRGFFREGRPVILNLIYYSCPRLCNLILNGQTEALREVAWTAGAEFEVVTVSIDPSEMWDLASRKKAGYLASLDRPGSKWNFLTDHRGNAKRLAEQVGFNYRWDAPTQQFVHAAAILFLTPDGRVSRYLYGARYKPRDIRLALTEASEGKLGSAADKFLMFCFHYDPLARSYVPFARNFMRAGATVIVFILALFLLRLWRREILAGARPMVTAK